MDEKKWYVEIEVEQYEPGISYTLMEGYWPLPVPVAGDQLVSRGKHYKVLRRTFQPLSESNGADCKISLEVQEIV